MKVNAFQVVVINNMRQKYHGHSEHEQAQK